MATDPKFRSSVWHPEEQHLRMDEIRLFFSFIITSSRYVFTEDPDGSSTTNEGRELIDIGREVNIDAQKTTRFRESIREELMHEIGRYRPVCDRRAQCVGSLEAVDEPGSDVRVIPIRRQFEADNVVQDYSHPVKRISGASHLNEFCFRQCNRR